MSTDNFRDSTHSFRSNSESVAGAHPDSYPMGAGGSLPGGKAGGT